MGITQGTFDWKLYPGSEIFLQDQVNHFLNNNQIAAQLAHNIGERTSTRFIDWIDHMVLPQHEFDGNLPDDLQFLENRHEELPPDTRMFHNPASTYFPVLVHGSDEIELALKPESIDDFFRVHVMENNIEGEKYSQYRKLVIASQGNCRLTAVERRGYSGFMVKGHSDVDHYVHALEFFSSRERKFSSGEEGIKTLAENVRGFREVLSSSRIADAFFRAERMYWTRKNKAAKVQKSRQDELGLGWGNHDHHTFRSSRNNFIHLMDLFGLLGMERRESFYAGAQAGWGAQLFEQPDGNIVIFADVDLEGDEEDTDFSRNRLPSHDNLGTVGLWVGLHGESILEAGMHHLAVGVDFEKQARDLPGHDVKVMAPFSNFTFLKQAFTAGETWEVDEQRVLYLFEQGLITREQLAQFRSHGALGSHLENIERGQGFKGFNQDSVSVIIQKTDPRKQRKTSA